MTSNKVLISGITPSVRREILFQSAVHWAEEGVKVIYITHSKFESLPSTGHGPEIPLPEVLSKIRIVYLQNEEKLLEFITDILTLRDTVPKVMLVEGLEELTSEGECRDRDHSLARACAVLSHVVSSCAIHIDSSVHLLVTVAITTERLPPVVSSMFDSLWSFESESNKLTRILPIESLSNPVLTFTSRGDGSYVLRQVSQLFVNSAR